MNKLGIIAVVGLALLVVVVMAASEINSPSKADASKAINLPVPAGEVPIGVLPVGRKA